MSGGSFDFLYSKDIDSEDFRVNLKKMIKFMKLDGFLIIANHLEKIDFNLDKAQEIKDNLNDVLHDYEWYFSGDSGKEKFEETMTKYLEKYTSFDIQELNRLTKEIYYLTEQLELKRKQLIDKLL